MNSQHGQGADVMGAAGGDDVVALLASMSSRLAAVAALPSGREELTGVVAAAQAVANAAAAVQDGAIAALAAVEGAVGRGRHDHRGRPRPGSRRDRRRRPP
ncbi:hypothetical protein ACK8HX_12270, partial [Oryzobacter sp. R7]|uniref:hypothetical protein n=1 Tax=Oryzobacter faecalis TaxID=3388656 RepID=UPI00398CC15D